ncbi:MAG: hypothetical protein ACRCYY_20270 [Trueperaceae bacterium]
MSLERLWLKLDKDARQNKVMTGVLVADIKFLIEKSRDEPKDGPNKAAIVRSAFAFVEVNIHWFRESAKSYSEFNINYLGADSHLKETVEKLCCDKNMVDNIKNSYKAFQKATSSNHELRFNNNEWKKIKEAIEIRKRLTHPKKVTDLDIGDEDFQSVYWAFFLLLSKFDLAFLHGLLAIARASEKQMLEKDKNLAVRFKTIKEFLENHIFLVEQEFDRLYKELQEIPFREKVYG